MSNWIHIPGFPPPEKQDRLKFYVLKDISYSTRITIYLLLIAFGFLIQFITMNAWVGAILLVFATALSLVRGFDSHEGLRNFKIDKNWTTVDMERIHEIRKLDDTMTKWDKDALDISNSLGAIAFILFSVGLFIFSVFMFVLPGYSNVGKIILTDAIILVAPLWFNGTRRIIDQKKLRIKIDIIRKMEEVFRSIKAEGEHFKPALMLARNHAGKSIPKDARFTISFDGMPADFYGLQAQININVIEGSNYPYFYCVIPAKVGFGLREYISKIPRDKSVAIEFQEDEQAEVIVIRQFTTKTSGYHTKMFNCINILKISLGAARIILNDK
ncbi:hypothetical protein [Acetivibrio mesophilus]|uniref:Uncharacterized protein n=1 Tax=Acetivibrio mesophilus TaxID=2487273 RepID=A0A4Q0I124_9FIRM|nr:hypothetical protein [Acetivibrio mesophilus]ODM25927.1 hypothetical protein A7W90_06625 [Clostridium sp. Bc-iso-3]RXE57930.1 hypothetical protein EFD62_14980 [Acetivibrio mesophilus]HHV29947.1 hypothetical protein [Clostridium sp.]